MRVQKEEKKRENKRNVCWYCSADLDQMLGCRFPETGWFFADRKFPWDIREANFFLTVFFFLQYYHHHCNRTSFHYVVDMFCKHIEDKTIDIVEVKF